MTEVGLFYSGERWAHIENFALFRYALDPGFRWDDEKRTISINKF